MAETRSLHRKLAQIMYEAERIPKNGTAPAAMGGFKFVQVGDAADFIRKALGEAVISMTPTGIDVIGQTEHPAGEGGKKTMTTLDLRVTWTLTDGESGESTTIVSYGAGADTGDKYSGKAMTNAMKYALLAGFQLSTGDDVELADTSDRQRSSNRPAPPPPASTEPTLVGPYSGAGKIVVRKSGAADGALRQGKDGGWFIVAFDATDDKNIPQVLVKDPLAVDLLEAAGSNLNGLVCEIGGDLFSVPYEKDGFSRPFQRLHLAWIRTAGWSLPAPAVAETHSGPVEPSSTVRAGAPTPEDERELDLALGLVK